MEYSARDIIAGSVIVDLKMSDVGKYEISLLVLIQTFNSFQRTFLPLNVNKVMKFINFSPIDSINKPIKFIIVIQ